MEAIDFQRLALIPGALDGYWLIACEESATIRSEFEAAGIAVMSCDLKPSRKSGPHYRGDVRDVLWLHQWAGIIAHPDCTYLTNAGVHHLHSRQPSRAGALKGPERWQALFEAAAFFRLFLDHPCERVIVENPVIHKYAAQLIGRKQTQTVQPYEYGHLETKRTALWLKGVPPLTPTDNVEAAMRALPKRDTNKVHYASPGEDRAERRSVFFQGIARAMVQQWAQPEIAK